MKTASSVLLIFAWFALNNPIRGQQTSSAEPAPSRDSARLRAGEASRIAASPALSSSGITNAGTTFLKQGIKLEFTVGEFVSATLTGPEQLLTQGTLQPFPDEIYMPVTLVDFRASRTEDRTVLISWSTTKEVNNEGFHVERRHAHEKEFTGIAFIKSAASDGRSDALLTYSFTDNNDDVGISYYRLKQVDTDGTSSYSALRSVKGAPETAIRLQAWPVPSPDGRVSIALSGAKQGILQVHSVDGRLLVQSEIREALPLAIQLPTPGTYLLRLANGKATAVRVIVE